MGIYRAITDMLIPIDETKERTSVRASLNFFGVKGIVVTQTVIWLLAF